MEKFITAAGCALRIRDEGRGPALMLLHGYLESLEVWDDLSPLLTRDFRLVSLDLPGHGVSQVVGGVHPMEFLADVARGVMDNLGVEKCVMVGHSMGGYVALAFLEKYPERLDGIVLLHSTPNPDSDEKRANRLREIAIVEEGKKEVLAGQSVPMGFAPQNRARFRGAIEDLAEQASLTDDEGITALLRGMMERPDRNKVFSESAVPEMMIFGRGDGYISPEAAQTLADNNPQARVVWLENSGHMGMIEEPAGVAEALKDFVPYL